MLMMLCYTYLLTIRMLSVPVKYQIKPWIVSVPISPIASITITVTNFVILDHHDDEIIEMVSNTCQSSIISKLNQSLSFLIFIIYNFNGFSFT